MKRREFLAQDWINYNPKLIEIQGSAITREVEIGKGCTFSF
jgi:hypothetical protein